MEKLVKDELNKYWSNLPDNLTDKESEYLLKVSKAIDEHKKAGTEPEEYLSSPETLLEMYHKVITKPKEIIDETMATIDMTSIEDLTKMQHMIELPFFMTTQVFEENISLYDCATEKLSRDEMKRMNDGEVKDSQKETKEEVLTKDSIKRFKASFDKALLNRMLLPTYEILLIRKQNPSLDFEQAHDCFSKLQDMALNHLTKTTGIDLLPSLNSSIEENRYKEGIRDLIYMHPRETLVIADGTKETKIFGLGDFLAKLNAVSKDAKAVDATNLTSSINRLQENPKPGFDKKMGIGGEFKEPMVSINTNSASR